MSPGFASTSYPVELITLPSWLFPCTTGSVPLKLKTAKNALKRLLEPGLGRNDLRRLVLDLEVPARLLLNILGTTVM